MGEIRSKSAKLRAYFRKDWYELLDLQALSIRCALHGEDTKLTTEDRRVIDAIVDGIEEKLFAHFPVLGNP